MHWWYGDDHFGVFGIDIPRTSSKRKTLEELVRPLYPRVPDPFDAKFALFAGANDFFQSWQFVPLNTDPPSIREKNRGAVKVVEDLTHVSGN